MSDSDLAQWLQSRGFYTLLILALLVLGLLLALVRRHRSRRKTPPLHRKVGLPVKGRRGRAR